MMRGVAEGDPWVVARFALEIGIALMVAAVRQQTDPLKQPESKQLPNFRHGEVPAKTAGSIRGKHAFLAKIFM
jgi:hypothetical protein